MPRLEIDPEDPTRVTLDLAYTETYLADLMPGKRHRGRTIHVPCTWATWMAAQGVFEGNLEVGPNYAEWLNREYKERVEPCLSIRGSTDLLNDPNTPWDDKLYGFQRAGVAFLALAQQALLGDDMGTGKTVQTVCTLRRLDAYGHLVFPALVVVPNSTKGQWAEHLAAWFPGVRVSVIGGGAAGRRKALNQDADVYVINIEAVRLHSRLSPFGDLRLLRCGDHPRGDPELKISRCEVHDKELNHIPFRTVVVDEAHRMKNPQSKQTRAIWSVMRQETVQFCYALTGTPIADHPGDLWPIMHGLRPDEYPTKSSYEQRYCLMSFTFDGSLKIIGINPSTRTEFFGFFDPRFRRMPLDLVAPYLPPTVYERRDAPMGPKQATAYKQMKQHLMARVLDEAGEDDVLVAPSNLAKNTRLLQFSSATCELHEDEVVMTEPSPKLDVMEEVLDETTAPVVVCAVSRKLILLAAERFRKRGIEHRVLVGGLTDDMRTNILRDFQGGRARALLFTMQAGGEGLNMTAASTMIRLERSWSMLINHQTVARVRRLGSEIHAQILVVDVVAPGTIEERQFKVLGEKTERLQQITRDKVTLREAGRLAELATLEREEQTILSSTLLPEGGETEWT